LVIGSGLAGASAAPSLAELGYNVKCFCSKIVRGVRTASLPRVVSTLRKITRTTATACSGYSTTRSKGGDFRSREANVYRLAQISVETSINA